MNAPVPIGEIIPGAVSGLAHAARLTPTAIDVEVHEVLEAGSQLGLIDDLASALLQSVYVDGMTGTHTARRFHTSAGTIRVRCSKAVRQLAAHAVELADAAA